MIGCLSINSSSSIWWKHNVLKLYSFVVGYPMLITVINEVNHHKAATTTHFSSSLYDCRLIKGCCIWIHRKDNIAST